MELDWTEVVMEKALQVLLVEDSAGDVRLTREAFRDANENVELSVVADGVEALTFLRREGNYVSAVRPELILLDLNMPRMDGREVLSHLKVDDSLKTIPIVVLTTSESEGDIVVKAYQLHANCYLNKPVDLDQFEELVKSINDFWLRRTTLVHQKWADGTPRTES
jgi:two-component system, chemotaxis family, response regulator Rcp1